MKFRPLFGAASALTILAGPAFTKVYLTIEKAQSVLFPDSKMTAHFRSLSDGEAAEIEKLSGIKVRDRQFRIWESSTGGWLIQDEVVGKHEFIPYVVALDAGGAFKGMEILEYREAYGDQIREKAWQQQFDGKTGGEKLKLGKDIKNISGATLSSRHITDGVSRLLATFKVTKHNGV